MRGLVSFHPIDLGFFDDLLTPLLGGSKVNPEEWLNRSLRLHEAARAAARYTRPLELLLAALQPPPPPESGTMWEKIRARLERLEYRPARASVVAMRAVDRDLHLEGRPFFITEGSADRVATIADEYCTARDSAAAEALALDQLVRLSKELGSEVVPDESITGAASLAVRRDLLDELRRLHDLSRAADADESWNVGGRTGEPARTVLARELPWRAIELASRAVPFWVARDVDGLETVCRAAGVAPPTFLIPATRLFSEACGRYPDVATALHIELQGERDVGAFVAPDDVPELIAFLNREGSGIIRAAAQAGEAEACTVLLRKIRECARYAEVHGMAYLEAAGIRPLWHGEEA